MSDPETRLWNLRLKHWRERLHEIRYSEGEGLMDDLAAHITEMEQEAPSYWRRKHGDRYDEDEDRSMPGSGEPEPVASPTAFQERIDAFTEPAAPLTDANVCLLLSPEPVALHILKIPVLPINEDDERLVDSLFRRATVSRGTIPVVLPGDDPV